MSMSHHYDIRNAKPEEFKRIGTLLIETYTSLNGFPSREEQPEYFKMLDNIGDLTKDPNIQIFVAVSENDEVHASVVYVKDMDHYASGYPKGFSAQGSSGMRLLAVDSNIRGRGLGKKLTETCIEIAKGHGHSGIILHTAECMPVAWGMYERMGFRHVEELDFQWTASCKVTGFRLAFV